jgi:hypothetical protein
MTIILSSINEYPHKTQQKGQSCKDKGGLKSDAANENQTSLHREVTQDQEKKS